MKKLDLQCVCGDVWLLTNVCSSCSCMRLLEQGDSNCFCACTNALYTIPMFFNCAQWFHVLIFSDCTQQSHLGINRDLRNQIQVCHSKSCAVYSRCWELNFPLKYPQKISDSHKWDINYICKLHNSKCKFSVQDF